MHPSTAPGFMQGPVIICLGWSPQRPPRGAGAGAAGSLAAGASAAAEVERAVARAARAAARAGRLTPPEGM